jgi:phage repressor protein C with HTH and peptisase S24 domain
MPTAPELFQQIARLEGLSIREIENAIGASNGVVSKAIKSKTGVNSKWLIKLVEKFPHYSFDSLIKNDESVNVNQVSEDAAVYKRDKERLLPSQMIPVYDLEATAGITPILTNPSDHQPEDYIYIPGLPKVDGFIAAAGDSMYPIIKAGDLVAFKQIHDVANIIPGEKYIVGIDLEGDEHILIKYLQRSSQGDDYLSLISYNENHQTIDIAKDRIKSIAIIKAILRFETNS